MPVFFNENVAQGLPASGNGFKVGISDRDTIGNAPEKGTQLPWLIDPKFSWLDYVCWIECYLDSGIVVHRPLPQSAQDFDTLGSAVLNTSNAATSTAGVNLVSSGNFSGVVQRMANSVYRFCLKGRAYRAGYQIPIPSLLSIAGVPAIPDDDPTNQKATNVIVANNSGVPIWHAVWELWYTVVVPPEAAQDPPDNLAEQTNARVQLPDGIQAPFSVPDNDAKPIQPPQLSLPTFIRRPRQGPGTAGS